VEDIEAFSIGKDVVGADASTEEEDVDGAET
jgi:hypothetical protein